MELTTLLNSEKFRQTYKKCHTDRSTVLTPQMAQNILEHQEVNTDKMVPEGVWIVEVWEPYGLFPSNYKKMINNEVVITRDQDTKKIVAMTFSDHLPCHRGTLFYEHFYSELRGLESLPLIKAHILKVLTIVQQRSQTKDVVLHLFVPLDAPVEETRAFLHGYLGLRKTKSVIFVEDGLHYVHCVARSL